MPPASGRRRWARRYSRPPTAARPGFSGARPAEFPRTRRAPVLLWRLGGLGGAGFGVAGFAATVFAAAGVTVVGFTVAGFTAAGLGVTAFASVGLASAGFTLGGLASGSLAIGMMPGESCAGAGPAPSSSASITRIGPQRIVSRHPDLVLRPP